MLRQFERFLKYTIILALLVTFTFRGYYIVKTQVVGKGEIVSYEIESPLQYFLLDPLGYGSLGFMLPYTSSIFINKSALQSHKDITVDEVVRHELKHFKQLDELGFLSYFFIIEKWKKEGVADYARGKSTVNPCDTSIEGHTAGALDYREYYMVVSYLIESMDYLEVDIYNLDSYPIDEAIRETLHQTASVR